MKIEPSEKRKPAAGHDGRHSRAKGNGGKLPPNPMSDQQTRRFLSRGEVSRLFGVSVSTVTRWARLGMLPVLRTPGGHYRFPAEETRRAASTASASPPGARPGRRQGAGDLAMTGRLRSFLERSVHSLDRPLEPGPRGLLVLASLPLFAACFVPAGEWEPGWMPFAMGALGLLTLRAAVYGKLGSLLDAFMLCLYFGLFRFLAHPRPVAGTYAVSGACILLGVALFQAWRQTRAEVSGFQGVG